MNFQHCGRPVALGNKFCESCGTSVAPAQHTCSLCQAENFTDAHCRTSCGAALSAGTPAPARAATADPTATAAPSAVCLIPSLGASAAVLRGVGIGLTAIAGLFLFQTAQTAADLGISFKDFIGIGPFVIGIAGLTLLAGSR